MLRMYKIPLEDLKKKIVDSGEIGSADLDKRIKDKINELSGLISEEGATHIIANELGIEVVEENKKKLKIKEVYAGMRDVNTVAKVIRKYEINTFSKGDTTGKVCSLIVGDETGTIRLVFWNEQVDLLDDVKEGTVLAVKSSYVRENNGRIELHLGSKGEIEINPEGEVVEAVRETRTYERKKIEELLGEEEGAEIMGTVVQVFDPRFFAVCKDCRGRAMESEGKFTCQKHGQVNPEISYVMNLVLDDGTGNIRGVFWKNQTNHLLDRDEQEVANYRNDMSKFEDIKTDLLGEQLKLIGKVKKNEMFDRLEFNVQIVERAKPEEEIARLEAS